MTTTKISFNDSKIWPIYRALSEFENIGAVYTGKGISPQNSHFSFHRPSASGVLNSKDDFISNLNYLAYKESFDSSRLTWPNGAWPHSGQAIKAEDYIWVTNDRTSGIMPVAHDNQPVTYDGIATRSHSYVLGAQGADCPYIFLYDPSSRIIGLVHAGWKPVVRGVIRNTVEAMDGLGATRDNIIAYITPGVGDNYEFQRGDKMEPDVKAVFIEADRHDLLEDRRLWHDMTDKDRGELTFALSREVHSSTSFKLSSLAATELEKCGVIASNISWSFGSSIVDRYPVVEGNEVVEFRYHSFRREQPNHGLSMGILFLKPESQEVAGLSR